MHRFKPHPPSPSMLVALLALFVALGGSAYAVTKAPKNSVVAKSIKKGAVTKAKLAPGAVGSPQIAAGAVTSAQLADGAVTGAKVAPGSISAANINLASLNLPKATTYKERTTIIEKTPFNKGATEQVLAKCLPGEQVVGGGGRTSSHLVSIVESTPFIDKTNQAWLVRVTNLSGGDLASTQISADVICAS